MVGVFDFNGCLGIEIGYDFVDVWCWIEVVVDIRDMIVDVGVEGIDIVKWIGIE